MNKAIDAIGSHLHTPGTEPIDDVGIWKLFTWLIKKKQALDELSKNIKIF